MPGCSRASEGRDGTPMHDLKDRPQIAPERHAEFKTGLWQYIRHSRWSAVLTAPSSGVSPICAFCPVLCMPIA